MRKCTRQGIDGYGNFRSLKSLVVVVGGLKSNIVSVPVPLGDLERPRDARRVRDR